ncbi:MAG: type II toxin-antitoxin system VapC family toxin [Dehalococcoidia bacterium]|nr:type II toxin-antitoxin system VapC family toxin [Dehalococcoidia bacterium]
MAVFYFDTSAIVKRYHLEQGTEFVDQILADRDRQDQFHTSFLTLLEVISAIERLADSGQLQRAIVQPTLMRFDSDLYQRFDLWPISNDLITSAAIIVGQYKLRSADAIHLATAMRLSLAVPDSRIAMVSSDRRLANAGQEAGILVLDPTARDAIAQLNEFRAKH